MAFRRLLRGRVPWETLEAIALEVVRRYDDAAPGVRDDGTVPTDAAGTDGGDTAAGTDAVDGVRVEFLDADNWLSEPMVVEDRWFVKVISAQHSLVHALLTTGRNLGAFTSGVEGFFEHFGTPLQMAEHELAATRRMRELGVNAPEPVEAFEFEGLGVLVLEYLPAFRTLDDLPAEEARGFAPDLFGALARMHDAGLAHGDLREENVLVSEGELYFIDATSVDGGAIEDARAYDLASALGSLSPHIGAPEAVAAALTAYDVADLLAAREFLDFVNMRPDHDFDAAAVKGEIETEAS